MKKKILVMVTGCPGCGKTHFANRILERFPFLELSSYDELKEVYFDKYGFDTLEERAVLNEKSLAEYYGILSDKMAAETPLLTEYPFNKLVHEKKLQSLVTEHGYQALTITLYGKPEVMLPRGIERDKAIGTRNPGHLLTRYHKDNWDEKDRIPAYSLEEFIRVVDKKGYFMDIGKRVEVDVTDFTKIDYEAVFAEIENLL